MRARIALAVTALLAAIVVVSLLSVRRAGSPEASRETSSDDAVPAPRAASGGPVPTLAKTPVPAAAAGSGEPAAGTPSANKELRHAILEVEVVDVGGKPVSGATVLAHGAFEGDMDLPPAPRTEGRTGADGRVELSVPIHPKEMAWPGGVLLHAFTDDAAAVSEMLDPWAPDPAQVGRKRVRLELGDPTTVSGRVTSYDGEPIAGADVRWKAWEALVLQTSSENDGTFRFPAVPAFPGGAGWITVDASKPGWLESEAHARSGPGPRHVVVRLGRMRTVSGRLVNPDGRPVAGYDSFSTDGSFTWGVPEAATEILLRPEVPYVHRNAAVPKGGNVDVGDLVVERGGTIRGRIAVDEPEARILGSVGWGVTCESVALGIRVREVTTDAKGEFVVDGIGPGEHVLQTSWNSHTSDVPVAQGEVRGVHAGDDGVRLVVYACGVLRLRPRTAGGDDVPVRGWVVEATGPHPETTLTVRTVPDRGRDRTNEMEGFVVGVPRPGTYAVRVKIPGFAWAERESVQVGKFGGDPVDLVVVPERR